ncbi:T9SS type A sorting domain-containing protein [candidate division KSB1 bacterium]|nr:T9SS type A sorting domain-containing protein [candidate division KSB1 bacterium]
MKYLIMGVIFFLAIAAPFAYSDSPPLYLDRAYEPIVIYGGALDATFRAGAPISDLYLCAYDAATQTWRVMPFQIDERFHTFDKYKPGKEEAKRHTYFIADEDVSFDYDDELVFLCGDLGDKAPDKSWIDDAESHQYGRVQITLWDPLDQNKVGYAYLYRSSTWNQTIPDKYQMAFDSTTVTVSSYAYQVRMSRTTSLIEDIAFKPPFGTGVDIFDTQKIRLIGYIYLNGISLSPGRYGTPAANEVDNLYAYPDHLEYTRKPRVRVVVERRMTIQFGPLVVREVAFYLTTKYYPHSGTVDGGADLNPDALKREFPGLKGTWIFRFDMLRQSWDFSKDAQGMKFYNAYNDGIPVDGVPDNPDTTLSVPIRQWNLCSGEQGSLFTYTAFEDTTWKRTRLYYYDNKNGGQGDGSVITGGDTGDGVSYGDMGFVLYSSTEDSVSLELGFTAYFLPKNYGKTDGEKLLQQVQNKVVFGSYRQTDVEPEHSRQYPSEFQLLGNYPNPFNGETRICFSLPYRAKVKVTVFDVHGRQVISLVEKTLHDGMHEVKWNGTSTSGQMVASGVYYCRLNTEGFCLQKKLLLLR